MKNHDLYFEMTELKDRLSSMENVLNEIKTVVKPEDELWDNADIIRYWKVCARTLAEWRSKGLIGFIQVGNKIWYPHEARELFLKLHYVEANQDYRNGIS